MLLLYVYCVSDEIRAEMAQSKIGVAGAELRLLQQEGVRVVVSEFSDGRVAITPENVLAHNRAISGFLSQTTPLPFRFGTVVDEAKLESYISRNRTKILLALEHVRGCVEMSVKVLWDAEAIKRESVENSGEIKSDAPMGNGARFLMAKRREIIGEQLLNRRAEEISGWVAEKVGSDLVRDRRVCVRPNEAIVVRAAYLVERSRLKEYRQRIAAARAEREGQAGLRFLTSGAWPPYSFSDLKS